MARKLPVNEIQIVPINEEKTIIPLLEQLNGLIDRYNAMCDLYLKIRFIRNESDMPERVNDTLVNIEKAIDALCLGIAQPQFMLKVEQ